MVVSILLNQTQNFQGSAAVFKKNLSRTDGWLQKVTVLLPGELSRSENVYLIITEPEESGLRSKTSAAQPGREEQ